MSRRSKQLIQATTYRVNCEQTAENEPFIKLPNALMQSLHWQVGDVIEWRQCRSPTKWMAVNLSVRVLYASRFRRNLTSVNKALNNQRHPLLRVVIKYHPFDQAKMVVLPKTWATQTANKKTVAGLFDIYVKALDIFGSTESTDTWLQSPALALDGRSPLEVLSNPQGAEVISSLLDRINYGVYT